MDLRRDWELTERIIAAALDVHTELGPGLVERIYEECLCWQLSQNGIVFKRQQPVTVKYREMTFPGTLRLDVVIEDRVVVEVKSVDQLQHIHTSQLLTYLKMSSFKTGLLINFNTSPLKQGIRRFVVP